MSVQAHSTPGFYNQRDDLGWSRFRFHCGAVQAGTLFLCSSSRCNVRVRHEFAGPPSTYRKVTSMFQRMRIVLVVVALVLTCLIPDVAIAASTPHHHHSVHPTCPAPGAPPQVSANAGTNQATVTWQAASGNGSQITAYVVTAYQGSSPSIAVATIGNALAATLYDLAGGISYTIQVYALSACGAGPATSSNTVTPTGSSTTYASNVEVDGPAVYYRLSEVSGTTAADSSGNGALGAYASGAGSGVSGAIKGDPDTAASWNGNCCGLLTSFPNLPYGTAARSLEVWIKTTASSFNYVMGYGQSGDGRSFNLGVGPNQVALVTYFDDLSWNTTTLNDGNWHYIVITYDGQNAIAYVDRQRLGSQTFASPINTLSSRLTVGCFAYGSFPCFNGSLDEVAVYNKVLTPAQVAAHYKAAGY